MAGPLDWARDRSRWPHAQCSTFVAAAGLRWHVQRFGDPGAPLALLLHGTGASTHSWRGLAPELVQRGFSVLAPDLPGHAFTGLPPGGGHAQSLSLPGMAAAVHGLLQALAVSPALLVGHSAGAAVALRMVLDGQAAPRAVCAINGALMPWGGWAGRLFSPAARMLSVLPAVPSLFAWRASQPRALRRLLEETGSRIDDEGTALYGRLVGDPSHVRGALGMMAQWDLDSLAGDLPRLAVPLLQLVGTRDFTVPPSEARRVEARLAPAARGGRVDLEGLGHLAHEEAPAIVAQALEAAWRRLLSPAVPAP